MFEQFLTFGDGPTDAIMADNAEWLDRLAYVPFLREVGRHFTINRMLTFDSVKLRLDREQPLTFLEFNYMILQAYDFLELSRREGCRLQMGGSDQWGNIVNGIELTRRIDGKEVFGVTTPLITTADGAKMGKTASGAVWLDDRLLSPYDYWQFWRNTQDGDVGRFLQAVHRFAAGRHRQARSAQGAEINQAKIVLATEATAMLHGREAAEAAAADRRGDLRRRRRGRGFADLARRRQISILAALTGSRLLRLERRSQAQDRRGRGAAGGSGRQRCGHDPSTAGDAPVKLSLGKKKHGLLVN